MTRAEQQAVRRAEQLLERTRYLADEASTEIVLDARYCARTVLAFADALAAERAARRSIQHQRDTAVAALERQAGAALEEANG
jgi:hypothetical protein